MAKKRKSSVRSARDSRETGPNLSVVKRAIDAAVAKIEKRAKALPTGAGAERRLLRSAVLALKLTKKLTEPHCGPRWFFLAR
jgi:hypothetical protein